MNIAQQDSVTGTLRLRAPRRHDGGAVHDLVRRCPPLDLNSAYAYHLLCDHFADTCVLVEQGGTALAFLSAYRKPQEPERLFVWQVAVDDALRGQGMAGRMLEAVLARPACRGVRFVETTVSPSNRSSRRFFERFAAHHRAGWHEEEFLTEADFGAAAHEAEVLFRIGPLAHDGVTHENI
jgi:L-2,4-diaminobutyric acid acetyltransferase